MLHRPIALFLLLTTCPVTTELIERGVHHLHQPRLGLDASDTDVNGHHDGDADDERDCTPWCHNCRCHARTVALLERVDTFDECQVANAAIAPARSYLDGRDADRPVLPPPIA